MLFLTSQFSPSFLLQDFDEQTTDDLDVDFSAYEEAGAGDKDIKDFLRIRQEERFVFVGTSLCSFNYSLLF